MIEFVIQFASSSLLVEENVRPPIAKAENAIKEAIDGVRGTVGRGGAKEGPSVRSNQGQTGLGKRHASKVRRKGNGPII